MRSHGNTPHRDGNDPRFHPACFPWKTILIHVMITVSPCLIRAARRWSSVMPHNRILPARDPSLSMRRQPTLLFNALSTPVILPQADWLCQAVIFILYPHGFRTAAVICTVSGLHTASARILLPDRSISPRLYNYRSGFRHLSTRRPPDILPVLP